MTREEAREIAWREVTKTAGEHELVILDAEVREYDVGWLFPYDSAEHARTGNIGDRIPGCWPILVDRRDGSAHVLVTAPSVEQAIDAYRRRR